MTIIIVLLPTYIIPVLYKRQNANKQNSIIHSNNKKIYLSNLNQNKSFKITLGDKPANVSLNLALVWLAALYPLTYPTPNVHSLKGKRLVHSVT